MDRVQNARYRQVCIARRGGTPGIGMSTQTITAQRTDFGQQTATISHNKPTQARRLTQDSQTETEQISTREAETQTWAEDNSSPTAVKKKRSHVEPQQERMNVDKRRRESADEVEKGYLGKNHTNEDILHEVTEMFIDSQCHLNFIHKRGCHTNWSGTESVYWHRRCLGMPGYRHCRARRHAGHIHVDADDDRAENGFWSTHATKSHNTPTQTRLLSQDSQTETEQISTREAETQTLAEDNSSPTAAKKKRSHVEPQQDWIKVDKRRRESADEVEKAIWGRTTPTKISYMKSRRCSSILTATGTSSTNGVVVSTGVVENRCIGIDVLLAAYRTLSSTVCAQYDMKQRILSGFKSKCNRHLR
ncbi:unnamed protein product [Nippostrongylus brasiliensis]|uniref:Uncharacterized protein n=1 Tax=Nippostrongylus brasiliensis TaxID=27835 RepID=A0A0N4Y0Z0_NIPBR|nr:unnamed protein product [Nippostrongylus brasiliensis]